MSVASQELKVLAHTPCPLWVNSRHLTAKIQVCSAPESGQLQRIRRCPQRAISRHHQTTLLASFAAAGDQTSVFGDASLCDSPQQLDGKVSLDYMYRLGIWLIAAAFVFNGAASHALIDIPMSPALAAHDHHHGHSATGHDPHFDHAGSEAIAGAPDHDHISGHEHGQKCCNICNVVSVMPDVALIPVGFSYAAITFHAAKHNLVGHFVALDPDIPKTIV